jgi:PAS domain S-box-containing protein
MALAPLVGTGVPFATYFVAILFVVWYGGFRAALLNLILSIGAGTYFFISPATTSPFLLTSHADRVTVIGFLVVSLVVIFLLDLQKRTLERVELEAVRRRGAENAEREQRQWFETTLASISDAVIATDAEGKVTFMNSVANALTGWHIAHAQGLPLSGPGGLERAAGILHHVATSVLIELSAAHFRLTHADGRVEEIRVNAGDIWFQPGDAFTVESLGAWPEHEALRIELKTSKRNGN